METFKLIVTVLGGLAIFVYGMGLMSDGLTRVAGPRLKNVLSYITRNRFLAILTGTLVTAAIQSSSATSVMTVGFVNAGLLNIVQAIGVIFGANIGTTITGQIIAFKLDDLALPAIIIAVIGLMIAKRTLTRGIFKTLLGFGLLFFGMTMMSHELKVVAKSPEFMHFFSLFDCTPAGSGFASFFSILGAVMVGTLCTMLVQSSSATIGITIALAEAGVISIWTAVPIVLGDNIGTTITAMLASINTNANAKRAALAHALFNLFGTIIVLVSFAFAFKNAEGLLAPIYFHLVDIFSPGEGFNGENPGRFVAMAHTVFNVANVIVLSPFIPLIARVTEFIIPGPKKEFKEDLEPKLLSTPELALEAAERALSDLLRKSWRIASVSLRNCSKAVDVTADEIERAEREVDLKREMIRDYLAKLSKRKINGVEARRIPAILHCINDAERIADLGVVIYEKSNALRFSENGAEEMKSAIEKMLKHLTEFNTEVISRIAGNYSELSHCKNRQWELEHEVESGTLFGATEMRKEGSAEELVAYIAVLFAIKDIARHFGNIAERTGKVYNI